MSLKNIPPYIPPHIRQEEEPKETPGVSPKVIPMVHRLSPTALSQIEALVDDTRVTANTTEGQAFFKLGIQHVLRVLREGFVAGS